MKIFRAWNTVIPSKLLHHGAITVGNFDGVHRGHEQVLQELHLHAEATGGPAIVVTFEPHPRAVLFPDEVPRRLCHLHERLALLERAGIDAVLLLHFNAQLALWTPQQFIQRLHETFCFKHIHVGYDFAFGHGRTGHADQLRAMGEQWAFTVSEAKAFDMQGAVVSSSRIRSAIEAADFKLAETLLGRAYSISGHVGKGDARGRTIGFPTANLDVRDLAHPPVGIYAVRVQQGKTGWNGAAYLGYRPTFSGRTLILEAHVFDDQPDLYHKRLEVTFIQRIREDRAFKNARELSAQIARDCDAAREILASENMMTSSKIDTE